MKLQLLGCAAACAIAGLTASAFTGRTTAPVQASVATAAFDAEVDAFFDREVPSHLAQIPEQGPLPDRVHGALTVGEFSWGTFVRALAAFAETRRTQQVAGRDVVPLIARVGVSESAKGSKAFAQLYAALALRHFGADLGRNAIWTRLSDSERTAWRSLLDPTRFYDPRTRRVIDLPENYLGVASRVATLAFQMKVLEDRAFVDALLDRSAEPFTAGALYADDAGTSGRYDRYSNEYARYVYEAAETVDRRDILDALRPSLRAQMELWWDLVSPDGYGYQWGRSLGVVSYLDTLEIVAFLARHPDLRPAPLPELASAYRQAWNWLRKDYRADSHMLSVFAPGRASYSYITKEREWQQTVGFFGKALMAHDTLMRVLQAERVTAFPSAPSLRPVTRFEFFRRGARPAGVWLVRQGELRFALPITTGTKPGVADYLPAPHGLPGFAAPVEQVVPAGASFLQLADGRVLVGTDGADNIEPSADGRSLSVTWRRFAVVGTKSGEFTEPGFTLSVSWKVDGGTLRRTETLSSPVEMTLRRLWLSVPSTATTHAALGDGHLRGYHLNGPEGSLDVQLGGDLPLTATAKQVTEPALGSGARGSIPTHIELEAADVTLQPGRPRAWTLHLTPSRTEGPPK